MIPLMSFGAGKFIYGFSHDPRYINKKEIGSDLIVTKKFEDGTQEDVYWRIRPEVLPVTEDLCDDHTIDVCWNEEKEECFKPCFQYGPQLITYAENVNKIFFFIDTSAVGATGIGPRFLFVGDLNKKQIKYLAMTNGFLKTSYSPDKIHIAFFSYNILTIVNILNDKIIYIFKPDIQTNQRREMHYLKAIHWISNNRFSYLDTSYGFNKKISQVIKNIYDVNEGKIIESKKIK